MDYIEARKILQREGELLDVLDKVTIHKGSVAYDAIKRMGQETYFEHHIMSGDAQVFDYDHNLLSVQDAQKRVFAPYEKPTVPLSDDACELAIALVKDGWFRDRTFENSPFLELFKKNGWFADGRTNESFREFCERHIDELDDYCEKMGKDIDEELHLILEEPFEISDHDDDDDDDEDYYDDDDYDEDEDDYDDEYDYEYEYVDEPEKDLKPDKFFTEVKDVNKKGERYSRYSILEKDPSDNK